MVGGSDDSVVLLREDGGEITLPLSQLSEDDKQWVRKQRSLAQNRNVLRGAPPEPPEIFPLPPLEIPQSDQTAPENSQLEITPPTERAVKSSLPDDLPADRATWHLGMMEARIAVEPIDFNTITSRPIPIAVNSPSGTRTTSLVVSISHSVRLANEKTRQQIVRFDIADQSAEVVLDCDETIQVLDHHLDSGRSLVLLGFNSLGRGGQFAMLEGWNEGGLRFTHRRSLEGTTLPGQSTRVHWARQIGRHHLVARIDETIGFWNLASGKQVYRFGGLSTRCEPAISGGGRYLAIPFEGGVDLIETITGRPLGRIKVESQVPGVSFSPLGNQLAIATSRRLRVWDLPSASLAADVQSRQSLGKGSPLWLDSDLLLTGMGTLVSLHRGVPIWRYEVAGTDRLSVGRKAAVLRKTPTSELTVMDLPHATAKAALERIDTGLGSIDRDNWQILGRSVWTADGWEDRDVQITGLGVDRR